MHDAAVLEIAARVQGLLEKSRAEEHSRAYDAASNLRVHLGFGDDLSNGRAIQVQTLSNAW
jgi:hypothetical protein